jgi:hypothetical protein
MNWFVLLWREGGEVSVAALSLGERRRQLLQKKAEQR